MTRMITCHSAGNSGVYFRKTFTAARPVKKAVLRITALGIYTCYFNETCLGDEVFMPGRTSYSKRLQVQTYDIADLLEEKNVIAVQCANGWYGKTPKLFAQVDLSFEDQSEQTVDVSASWRVSDEGPLGFNDMKLGEFYDASKELSGWTSKEYDDSSWKTPEFFEYEGELIETEGEPIREKEVFTPIAILSQNDGTSVLDFGQNIAGYMEFTVTGHAGEEAEMVYGEVLDQDGQFTQSNLSFAKNRKTGRYPQTVVYSLKEGTQTWKPQASVHGFRYVKLIGWPEEVKAENFKAIAVYSDLKQTGSFECSDSLINRLASNCRWSMKGNYLDIPTDCPTRERAGWTGDAMVYCVPAAYQMDIYRFTKKWLKDVILEQNPDGSIKNIVPDGGMPVFMDGAAGWSDAIVKIPYELYRFYGKKEILEMCWPAIRRHITFMENRAAARKPWHLNKGAHYDCVIDTGFHWGEWLEPGTSMPSNALKGFTVPDAEVATAYFAWSAGKAAEIAGILGRKEDGLYYQQLHEKVKAAYQKEFLPHGLPESGRQCRFVRPLALGLARPEDCGAIAAKLNEMILKNNCRIGTGFLSTPHVCRVLSDYGYTETAWRLLENKEQPGWLFEVGHGATTIWENWYGLDQNGKPVNSWNHYSPGAVIAWLYDSAAGITPLEPGFEKIRIAPKPGGSLTSLNASFESAAGLISVRWEKEGRHVKLMVETPAETEMILPDGTKETVPAGSYEKEFDLI